MGQKNSEILFIEFYHSYASQYMYIPAWNSWKNNSSFKNVLWQDWYWSVVSTEDLNKYFKMTNIFLFFIKFQINFLSQHHSFILIHVSVQQLHVNNWKYNCSCSSWVDILYRISSHWPKKMQLWLQLLYLF